MGEILEFRPCRKCVFNGNKTMCKKCVDKNKFIHNK